MIGTHHPVPTAPKPAAASHHPVIGGIADPAALGLGAFGMSTALLSFGNAGIVPTAATAVLGLGLFYGGIAQLIAGIWEFVQANTFGALAFVSYGSFWLAYWWTITNPDIVKEAGGAGMGTFLMLWAVFTTFMIVPCTRISNLLTALFTAAAITFILLAIAEYTSSEILSRIAGYIGLVVGALGLYGCFASVVNATWRRSIIPLGSRNT
ncbi:acetate uptake transporter [Microbacterium sp. QXD-8]|uniref:Acetate uptake transporter n=1 Tax=Microbacterium psychrotolerans TaxID=3068321 RepID=A0ABU0Z1M3_9MICO|nr:acetate uptake transporter [Microbacterium sp. QXD-8]MDQ7877426.1 acetate uptake transporter [Microbacterium sp. QXD-8]